MTTKSIPITEAYNCMDVVGSAKLIEEAKELLVTGEYVIVPALTEDTVVELAIINEKHLLKKTNNEDLRDRLELILSNYSIDNGSLKMYMRLLNELEEEVLEYIDTDDS